jgi:hypothetical protein
MRPAKSARHEVRICAYVSGLLGAITLRDLEKRRACMDVSSGAYFGSSWFPKRVPLSSALLPSLVQFYAVLQGKEERARQDSNLRPSDS